MPWQKRSPYRPRPARLKRLDLTPPPFWRINMNAKKLIAIVLTLSAAGAALAQSSAPASGVTRAQVQAELRDARAHGELASTDLEYPKTPQTTSTVTRAQVKAE